MSRLRVSLLSICALSMVSGHTPAALSAQRPTFATGVDLVQLDVIVLDKDRRPVTGLTAADFTIEEDGKAVPLEAFAPISLPVLDVTTGAAWTRDVAPDVVTNQRAEDGRLVTIILDRTIPVGAPTLTARSIAHATVDVLGPTDMAAIVRTSGFAGEGVQQNFTADRRQLREAIDVPFMGLTVPPSDIGGITPASGECICGLCVLESITRTADALARDSRRHKMLIFIGSEIGIEGRAWSSDVVGMDCEVLLLMERERTLRAIDRGNITFHSLDPRILETVGYSAEQRTMPNVMTARRGNLLRQSDLAALPEYTGGRAVANTNGPQDQMPAIFAESQSYYLLGFRRTEGERFDRRRTIRVRVNRGDVVVRSRTGYYAPSREAVTAAAAVRPEADAVGELLPKSDIPLELGLTPRFLPDGGVTVSVLLGIGGTPPDESDSPAQQPSFDALFDVVIGVFDHQARSVGSERQSIEVPAVLASSGADRFESLSHLSLKPGRYEVRVGIASLDTSTSGSVYGYVEVPDIEDEPWSLSGVLLGAHPEPAGEAVVIPGSAPVAPTLRRSFAASDLVSAFVQVQQRQRNEEGVMVRARVLDVADRTVADTSSRIDASALNDAGVADLRFDLPVSTLPSGRYLLSIEATAGQRTERRDVPFTVR